MLILFRESNIIKKEIKWNINYDIKAKVSITEKLPSNLSLDTLFLFFTAIALMWVSWEGKSCACLAHHKIALR